MDSQDLFEIRKIAREYGLEKVLLFGSVREGKQSFGDIDLAVSGVSPADYFRLCGDLLLSISKPVDIIDLADNTAAALLVEQDGEVIYERSEG